VSAMKKLKRKEVSVFLGDEMAEYLSTLKVPKRGLMTHWEKVAAPHLVLHTDNVVYCTKTKNNTILVYVDSAAYATEMTMDKELYRLKMQKVTKKEIADIKFLVSRKSAQRKRK